MGKHQLRLLKFAIRFCNSGKPHSYGKDRITVRAINSLEKLGLIDVNREFRQFTLHHEKDETNVPR